MKIMAVYTCRNCGAEFTDPSVYREDVTVDEIVNGLQIQPQYNKIQVPSTSTMYRRERLNAPLIRCHNCPVTADNGFGKRIGIADLTAFIPEEEDPAE